LTAGQLDEVVVGFGVKEKTRNEYRMMLNNLYSWAAKQNPPMVPRGFNAAKEMDRHKVKHHDVEFLRVPDLRTVLATAPTKRPDLVPLIVLVCFAGLRPSETIRLDWCDVGADYIRLPGKKSKTGYSRQIPIAENLKAWLALWRKTAGPICPGIDLSHLDRAIRHFSWVRLSHDALRHGFGTHRQKIVKNVGAVADEMGNTAHIWRRHYLNAFCTEEEASEWFSLMPTTMSNIIKLPGTTEVESVVAGAKST
jgi:integrase